VPLELELRPADPVTRERVVAALDARAQAADRDGAFLAARLGEARLVATSRPAPGDPWLTVAIDVGLEPRGHADVEPIAAWLHGAAEALEATLQPRGGGAPLGFDATCALLRSYLAGFGWLLLGLAVAGPVLIGVGVLLLTRTVTVPFVLDLELEVGWRWGGMAAVVLGAGCLGLAVTGWRRG
jgi:hypothetical protein